MIIKELEAVLVEYEAKNYPLEVVRHIRSGKEAQLYLVIDQHGNQRALKVYKDPKERAFTDNQQYLAGRYFRNQSVRKAVKKKNKLGRKILHHVWTKREYFLLKDLYKKGAHVPQVFNWTPDSVVMQFIGANEIPAPRLSDITLTQDDALMFYEIITKNIDLFLKNGIVHSDLSPYNILINGQSLYIIDFPQAVDIRTNENWEVLLERDRHTIELFFKKYL